MKAAAHAASSKASRERTGWKPSPDTLAKQKEQSKAWHDENGWKRDLRRNYQMTPAQYQALFDSQGGVCAGCGAPPVNRRLDVDHDHLCCPGRRSCGECVRGLLCRACNWELGKIEHGIMDGPCFLGLREYLAKVA